MLGKYLLSRLLIVAALSVPLFAQTEREAELLKRIENLEKRLAALEDKSPAPAQPIQQASVPAPPPPPQIAPPSAASVPGALSTETFAGTTINVDLDGYYGYNFNRPPGRMNPLRSNDVLTNSFTLNQVGLVIERTPDESPSKRLGYRLDLMFGQNTETLQGSAQNELRPQVYRNIFQAYGTVVAPVGTGVTLDFGKFASSLGIEGNYTKDQLNYSRSYLFDYLPFYHMGVRATHAFGDRVSLQYWLVNGANQTEDFNGFKSNAFLLTLKPTKTLSWNLNYYFGQDGRDALKQPDGKQHIFDTYATWNPNAKTTLMAEGDYVINRNFRNSSPAHVSAVAGYAKYQLSNAWSLAGRFEYLSDRGGLFTNTTQAVKEATMTATYQFTEGFQLRGEYRKDFSNVPFFLTDRPGQLKRQQDTATLGILYWLGGKQGAW